MTGYVHFDDVDEHGMEYEFDRELPTLRDAFVYAMTHYGELAEHFYTNTEVEVSGKDDGGREWCGLIGDRIDGSFVFITTEPTGDGVTSTAVTYELGKDGTIGKRLNDDEW